MNVCVVGLQWGDEGKGKIIDILSESADVVVRYNGGANAGHSVVRTVGEDVFALHLLPSGILHDDVLCVIANGVAVDPETLLEEIAGLKDRGVEVGDRLRISDRAHVVMDYHKKQDRLSEQALGSGKIGTTIRGIGPCYADKVVRTTAVRAGDLLNLENLADRIHAIADQKNKIFAALYGDNDPLDPKAILDRCKQWADALAPHIVDTADLLHRSKAQGKSILFEGAQGSLLDLDHGTFPFVTSSNCSALGLSAGSGFSARAVDKFVGVVKAYTSRVGSGPFPTEQDNQIGQFIRDRGHEYGTTTGRPRRCGWFDLVSVRYSITIGGIDELAMLHLDTFAGLKELSICRSYTHNGRELECFCSDAAMLGQVECKYETMGGFDEDISSAERFDDLPENARNYVLRAEELLGVPITMVGVGPGRTQTLFRPSN